MKFFKPKLSPTAVLIVLLPILLGVLATLQYRWLGEISTAERERMQTRLQSDARRFAQDFNTEITKTFFSFQLDLENAENAEKLGARYEQWRRQSQFPELVSEIYITKKTKNGERELIRYDVGEKQFAPAIWADELKPMLEKINAPARPEAPPFVRNLDSVTPEVPALLIPFFERREDIVPEQNRFFLKTLGAGGENYLIVRFDSAVITNELIPQLSRRHFSDSNFAFAIFNKETAPKTIYQSQENFDFTNADAAAGIFEISADSTNILLLNAPLPRERAVREGTYVFQSRAETRERQPVELRRIENLKAQANKLTANRNLRFQSMRTEKNENTIISKSDEMSGKWLLKISHADGSLESFVNKTRWRNLGVSFGILTLLGASVVLLILSTNRATRAAQRQLDFVSSVTHEFRTPIAVICSAGDNIADGIVKTPEQIEKYGKLIRREGNRLSEMVEQILEFAGARARRPKYDLQPVSIPNLIETVLTDCQPLIEEKGFIVEKQIAAHLPEVLADPKAFKQSLQNLVSNAIKYSNGSNWIRISAKSEQGQISISVEDEGFGIDAREQRQIFEPFYRGQRAVAEQIHGNGLGLSLVKKIVEAHGGEIKVHSETGKGSRFTIQIPAALSNLETQRRGDAEFIKV